MHFHAFPCKIIIYDCFFPLSQFSARLREALLLRFERPQSPSLPLSFTLYFYLSHSFHLSTPLGNFHIQFFFFPFLFIQNTNNNKCVPSSLMHRRFIVRYSSTRIYLFFFSIYFLNCPFFLSLQFASHSSSLCVSRSVCIDICSFMGYVSRFAYKLITKKKLLKQKPAEIFIRFQFTFRFWILLTVVCLLFVVFNSIDLDWTLYYTVFAIISMSFFCISLYEPTIRYIIFFFSSLLFHIYNDVDCSVYMFSCQTCTVRLILQAFFFLLRWS